MNPKRPALLTVGIYGSIAGAALLLLAMLAAAAGIGSYQIDEVEVSGSEFLSQLGVVMIIFALLLLTIAYALITGREWSRELMILFWLGVGAQAFARAWANAEGEFRMDLTWMGALVIAIWYLYFSRDATLYYRSLEARAAQTTVS